MGEKPNGPEEPAETPDGEPRPIHILPETGQNPQDLWVQGIISWDECRYMELHRVVRAIAENMPEDERKRQQIPIDLNEATAWFRDEGLLNTRDLAYWEAVFQERDEEKVRVERTLAFLRLRAIGELDVMGTLVDRLIEERGSEALFTGELTVVSDGIIDMEGDSGRDPDTGTWLVDAIYRGANINYDLLTVRELQDIFEILNRRFEGRFEFSIDDTVTSGKCVVSASVHFPDPT